MASKISFCLSALSGGFLKQPNSGEALISLLDWSNWGVNQGITGTPTPTPSLLRFVVTHFNGISDPFLLCFLQLLPNGAQTGLISRYVEEIKVPRFLFKRPSVVHPILELSCFKLYSLREAFIKGGAVVQIEQSRALLDTFGCTVLQVFPSSRAA